MCGIAGFVDPRAATSAAEFDARLERMGQALRHRGPDNGGNWCDAASGVGLAHRRLAIVDLSPLGHQPMHSASARYVLAFNGEIYNYQELKRELAALGAQFRGSSDTEVLLAGFEAWGFVSTLQRAAGMFAIACWDRQQRELLLARDRFGEKPLYYGRFGEYFGFASELKALRTHPHWQCELDRDGMALLLRDGCIPAPLSIYRNIGKLLPGQYARVRWPGAALTVATDLYFDATAMVGEALRAQPPLDAAAALEATAAALTTAVRRQMVADVPVGAFLSGGIDSSLIVSVMQSLASQPVRSFSIGFSEQEFNEAPFAREVARHLGTHHTELMVTPHDTLQVIPSLPEIYDEPFADSSQIPTILLSRLTRSEVTVSLSGDAGDELFGGYSRYPRTLQQWARLQRVPAPLRQLAGTAVDAMPRGMLHALLAPLRLAPPLAARVDLTERMQERAGVWRSASLGACYEEMSAIWRQAHRLVPGASAARIAERTGQRIPDGLDLRQQMMFRDMGRYMIDDVLVKVDRAAMSASLETRVPFLDPGVAATAWRIPAAVHYRDGSGKWVLRQLLDRHVPRALVDRPKQGFGVPIAAWLRRELRPWAEALLDPARLRREGNFAVAPIAHRWQQHLTGRTDWSFHLWHVLMFQAWLESSSRSQRATG